MRLDLLLPAYKPHQGWELDMLKRLKPILRERPEWDLYVYIATDGSLEGHSPELRSKLCEYLGGEDRVYLVHYAGNRGKGYALRSALALTEAEYIMYTDYDLPFTTESYLSALDALREGYDLVCPQRDRAQYTGKLSWMRRFLSNGSMLLNRLLLSLPKADTQAGVKAFGQEGRQALLATTIDRFLFDTEFVALAVRRRLRIASVPCRVREDIRLSPMGLKVLRNEFHYIPRLIRARWFS